MGIARNSQNGGVDRKGADVIRKDSSLSLQSCKHVQNSGIESIHSHLAKFRLEPVLMPTSFRIHHGQEDIRQ